MPGRSLLHTAPHHRHVVAKATQGTLAGQLTPAHLGENIFANRNAAHLVDTVIIYMTYAFLCKSPKILPV